MGTLRIREATPSDAEKLLGIYSYYVENTAITFEYDVPTVSEFRSRIESTLKRYPYIVAERDGDIVGYAYAGVFKDRAAYDRSCELSVYVKNGLTKGGVGKALYAEIEKRLKATGILNLYACIGYPEEEDEYLTRNSAEFHEHLDFKTVGRFHKCGYKFRRWYDMIWMEKLIGEHE